jgi:hypothetical protein
VEVAGEVFNLLNGGHYTEFSLQGANRRYNPQTFATYTNPQTPRAATLQATVRYVVRESLSSRIEIFHDHMKDLPRGSSIAL